MIASRPEQPPRILDRHVGLPDMHAVGACNHRHIDAVVDHQRHAERRERRLDGAGALDHDAGVALLIPQLHQCCAALREQTRELRKIVAAGALRIDNRIEPHVDSRHVTLPRWRKVAWSRP